MARTVESPFMTTEEAARYLRIEPKTLHNMRWRGQGPNYHKHGGRVFYPYPRFVALVTTK